MMELLFKSLRELKVKCVKKPIMMLQLFPGFLCMHADERYLHFKDGRWIAMKLSETALLESGFSHDELQKINNNVEIIQD